jgi:hypothetical protein
MVSMEGKMALMPKSREEEQKIIHDIQKKHIYNTICDYIIKKKKRNFQEFDFGH